METLGKRIKELRKLNKLNQAEFSNALNNQFGLRTDRVMISKWETGFQTPVMSTIVCIAKFFGVTIDYLNGNDTDIPRIKKILSNTEKSPDELSELTGIPRDLLLRFFNDEINDMTISDIEKISKGLNISPVYLSGWVSPIQNNALNEIVNITNELSEDNKQKLIDYGKLLLNSQK